MLSQLATALHADAEGQVEGSATGEKDTKSKKTEHKELHSGQNKAITHHFKVTSTLEVEDDVITKADKDIKRDTDADQEESKKCGCWCFGRARGKK